MHRFHDAYATKKNTYHNIHHHVVCFIPNVQKTVSVYCSTVLYSTVPYIGRVGATAPALAWTINDITLSMQKV